MDMRLALGQHPAQINQVQTVIQVGVVGNPAPTSFADQVSVLPQDAPQNPLGPMPFLATRGATLPALDDTVIVVYDENRTPYALPISGVYTTPATIDLAPVTAPAAPAVGFTLYVDAADGGLKAISSTGTVTTVATPEGV